MLKTEIDNIMEIIDNMTILSNNKKLDEQNKDSDEESDEESNEESTEDTASEESTEEK